MNIEYSSCGIQIFCDGFRELRISADTVVLYQGEENTRRHEEQGEVVLVTEHRILDGGNRKGHIVIRVSVYSISIWMISLYICYFTPFCIITSINSSVLRMQDCTLSQWFLNLLWFERSFKNH